MDPLAHHGCCTLPAEFTLAGVTVYMAHCEDVTGGVVEVLAVTEGVVDEVRAVVVEVVAGLDVFGATQTPGLL